MVTFEPTERYTPLTSTIRPETPNRSKVIPRKDLGEPNYGIRSRRVSLTENFETLSMSSFLVEDIEERRTIGKGS